MTLTPPVYSSHLLKNNLRVRQGILKKLLSICGTVITFLSGHCQNCRTVVSLGSESPQFFIEVLSNFAMTIVSPLCFAMVSARRLSHLLSTLRICNRVVQDIPKKLSWICRTVVTFLCARCPNCRTVVSLGRSLWAATLKPPNPHFGAWLRSLTFLIHSL